MKVNKIISTALIVGASTFAAFAASSILHLKYEDRDGTTAYDASGMAKHGTIVGNVSRVIGRNGDCFKFNELGNFANQECKGFVKVQNGPTMGSVTTINAWVKLENDWVNLSGNHPVQTIVEKGDDKYSIDYNLSFDFNKKLRFCFKPASSWYVVTDNSGWVAPVNVWNMITLVVDKSNSSVRFYVNGTLKSTQYAPALWISSNSDLNIGRASSTASNAWPLYGSMDELQMFDYALTTAEMLKIYQRNRNMLYKFDETTGSIIYDNSGNTNNGTVSGGDRCVETGYPMAGFYGFPTPEVDPDYPNEPIAYPFIRIPSSSKSSFSSDMTFMAWVKVNTVSAACQTIIQKGDDNTSINYDFSFSGNNHLRFGYKTTGVGPWVIVTEPNWTPKLNTWYMVAVSVDKATGTVSFFVNGSRVSYVNKALGYTTAAGDVIIGRSSLTSTNPAGLFGSIDELMMYNYSMSAGEILAIYNKYVNTYFNCKIGHFKMDAITGGKAYESCLGIQGNVGSGVMQVSGISNTMACRFDGSANGQILFNNVPSVLDPLYLTVSAWIKLDKKALGGQVQPIIFMGDKNNLNDVRYQVALDDKNQLVFSFTGGNGTYTVLNGWTAQLNTWHLITVTRTVGNNTRFYADGLCIGSYTYPGMHTSLEGPLYIGAGRTNITPWKFNGTIDDVRLYDKTLTATEITHLYGQYIQSLARKQQDVLVGSTKITNELLVSPTPFNPTTNITIPQGVALENVTLSVFNLQGQAVKTFKNMSSSTVVWNASGMPSGQYFVKMFDGRKILTKSITLMK